MSQNRSSAVMAQRIEADDSLDDFPTQPWGTRALMEHVICRFAGRGKTLWGKTVWEPACNRGFMARPLSEYFGTVITSDVHDYGYSAMWEVRDFLMPMQHEPYCDWIITNPPFRLAEQFISRGRHIAAEGCAMLVRTSFLEGIGRYKALYRDAPPTFVAVFSERLPLIKGRVDPKVSSATSYSWLVWVRDQPPQPTLWIPPCRKKLERASDYV